MVFDKLKSLLGAGAAVDTIVTPRSIQPGGTLTGEVRLTGGDAEQEVNEISLTYTALVTIERDGKVKNVTQDFFTVPVTGPFTMDAGGEHVLDFEAQIPWEAPISTIAGRPMAGIKLGIVTNLDMKLAMDKSDLDALAIDPLPVQEAIMSAIEKLGFTFQEGDLEPGTIPNSYSAFYQEIIFWATGDYASKFQTLEVTFVAGPNNTDVIFQINNSSDLLNPDNASYIRFKVPTHEFGEVDAAVTQNLEQLLKQQGL